MEKRRGLRDGQAERWDGSRIGVMATPTVLVRQCHHGRLCKVKPKFAAGDCDCDEAGEDSDSLPSHST